MRHHCTFAFAAALLLFSCTQDAYEKGEGTYSLMRGDLVEAHAGADTRIDRLITDDGDTLAPTSPLAHEWGTTADTTYRAVCYYRLKAQSRADIVACHLIATDTLTDKSLLKGAVKTDPVKVESIWMGRNRRYLNVSLYLKTGVTTDQKATRRIGFVRDTVVTNADNTKTLRLKLFHDQGGVPEHYYSSRTLISIPLHAQTADSISLSIQTYDGWMERLFKIRE